MNNPFVSVIVPAFNVEKYISRCLDSLINQTLQNIQIIVVDDGSTDNTYKIAESYSQKDSRIKLIHQENSGVSIARNNGMKFADGEYISFLDSDDSVDLEYFEKLYNSAVNNGCDIAVASMIRKREHSQKYRMHYQQESVYTTLQGKMDVCKIPVCCYACGKLYKTSLIKDFCFKSGIYFEDVFWTPQVLCMANKLVTVPDVNYYYWVNGESIVKSVPSPKKQQDCYKAKKFVVEFFEEKELYLSRKNQTLTKKICYWGKIPVLKIKEYKDIEYHYLLGVLLVYKKKQKITMLSFKKVKRMFFFRCLDSHIYVNIFGIHLSFKTKNKFRYKEASEWGLTIEKRNPKLVVSLTSFPERISVVEKTINTLLNQTLKPDELILWLAEEQFSNKEDDLPKSLLKLKDFGLKIKWCEDIKSYKKLVPTLREFPNDVIVTADDDLYYQRDWLESLYNEYLKNPKNIYTRRACRVEKSGDGLKIFPHYDNRQYKPSFTNQLMGGAGTLYPPGCLHSDVFDSEKFMNLLPTYDDIYFWIMAVANNTKIGLVKNKDLNFYNVENSQEKALCKINGAKVHMNDREAFSSIFYVYPDIIEKLR